MQVGEQRPVQLLCSYKRKEQRDMRGDAEPGVVVTRPRHSPTTGSASGTVAMSELHGTARSVRSSQHGSGADELPVVELPLVHEHVRVRVRGDGEVALPDVLADPGPRHAAEVQQGNAPVPEIVR